jgi:hypothetical protein
VELVQDLIPQFRVFGKKGLNHRYPIGIGHRVQRIIGVAAMLEVGELRMHVVCGIRGALLGDLALAGNFAHELQAGLKLLWRQIVELLFEFESALICRPHIVEHHVERGDARGLDFGLPSGGGLIRRAPLPSGIFPMAAARHGLISFDCFSKIVLQCIHIFRHRLPVVYF